MVSLRNPFPFGRLAFRSGLAATLRGRKTRKYWFGRNACSCTSVYPALLSSAFTRSGAMRADFGGPEVEFTRKSMIATRPSAFSEFDNALK